MYQIAYIGRWETLPETAAAICDYDTSKLEVLLQGGLDLDDPIQLSEYIKLTPLEIAVFRNDVPMIHFLLGHGADPGLAEEQPLLLTAARCCGPEVVALFAGQAAKLSLKQKERAFQEVRWGKRPENIPVLEQAGITVDKFGGEAFRAAVSEGNAKLARLLLEKGADINYHKPDMVFPYASTPVTEAARSNNFSMVRWLVEQGANITLADKYGDRPYSVAVQNKNQEMADPVEALQPVCAPFTEAEDYSWFIYVREQMVERYGTAEQMEEYRRQAELRGTPGHKAKNWMGSMLFHLSHANDVDQAWASSRTREELDQVVEPFVQAKRQTGQWTQEDEAGYQLYRQETDPKKRTFRVWYLIANPRGLPKEFVQKELEFRWKLFPEKKEETK